MVKKKTISLLCVVGLQNIGPKFSQIVGLFFGYHGVHLVRFTL